MPRCYLMVEDFKDLDGNERLQVAYDLGQINQELPETVEDMTPAQYTIWQAYNVIRATEDPAHGEAMKEEMADEKRIVIPTSG